LVVFTRILDQNFRKKISLFLISEVTENNYRDDLYDNINDLYTPIKGKCKLVQKQQALGINLCMCLMNYRNMERYCGSGQWIYSAILS
jgi:hypothetical protein